MFPHGVPVTLHTRGVVGQDAYGNDVYGDTDTVVEGCAFDPGSSLELVQGQDMVRTQPTVYAPSGTAVTAVDALTVNGVRYEVDGSPNDYHSPFTGWGAGVVIRLKGVTG